MKHSITLILFFSFKFHFLGQPADDAEATTGDTGTAPRCSTPAANSASDSAPAAPAAAPQAASMVTAPHLHLLSLLRLRVILWLPQYKVLISQTLLN